MPQLVTGPEQVADRGARATGLHERRRANSGDGVEGAVEHGVAEGAGPRGPGGRSGGPAQQVEHRSGQQSEQRQESQVDQPPPLRRVRRQEDRMGQAEQRDQERGRTDGEGTQGASHLPEATVALVLAPSERVSRRSRRWPLPTVA